MNDGGLTHLDPLGRARMVDVTPKEPTIRRALARGRVVMNTETTSLDEMRAEVVRKLTAGLAVAESPREVASVAKALASLEKNDIDRTKLLIDAETQEGGGLDDARRLRADLDEIDRMEGRRAD